jgi:hypothetical protein
MPFSSPVTSTCSPLYFVLEHSDSVLFADSEIPSSAPDATVLYHFIHVPFRFLFKHV